MRDSDTAPDGDDSGDGAGRQDEHRKRMARDRSRLLVTLTIWLGVGAALYALFIMPLEESLPPQPPPPPPPAEGRVESEDSHYSETGRSCAEELSLMSAEDASRYECVAVHFASNGILAQDAVSPRIASGKISGRISPQPGRPLTYGVTDVLVLRRSVTQGESPDLPTKAQRGDKARAIDSSLTLRITAPAASHGAACGATLFFGGAKAGATAPVDCSSGNDGGIAIDTVAAAASRSNNRAFVYVHGMGNRFDQAAVQAAQLAADVQTLRLVNRRNSALGLTKCDSDNEDAGSVVVDIEAGETFRAPLAACYDIGAPLLFHWRNHEDPLAYGADKKLLLSDGAAESLAAFLIDLSQTRNVNEINILAHSMGSRVLVGAWEKFAKALAKDQASAPRVNIVHASSELELNEYDEAVARLNAALKGTRLSFRRSVYASPDDLMMTAARLAEGELSQFAASAIEARTFVGRVIGVKRVVRSLRYRAADVAGELASLVNSEAKVAVRQKALDLMAVGGASCRVGDVTDGRCKKMAMFLRYKRDLDRPGFKDEQGARIEVIESPASFTIDSTAIFGPRDLERARDWAKEIGAESAESLFGAAFEIAAKGQAYIESGIDHRGPLAKALAVTDLACFYDGVEADPKARARSLAIGREHGGRYYEVDEKSGIPNECNPNGLVFVPADPTPAVVGASEVLLGSWPFKIPTKDDMASPAPGPHRFDAVRTEFLNSFDGAVSDTGDFACSRRWVAVVAAASSEGASDLNTRRAEFRAAVTAQWLNLHLDAAASLQDCPPPLVFGVSLGQHVCDAVSCESAAMPDAGSAFQRRIRLIDRPRNDLDLFDRAEGDAYEFTASEELDAFLRKRPKRLKLAGERYPAPVVVWSSAEPHP